jgi:hypothetical protein
VGSHSEWILTDDGDDDPNTRRIPGEQGRTVHAPAPLSVNYQAKVAVHVTPHAARACAKSFPVITDCSDIVATCAANDVDFFPVFFGLEEYQAVEYGVDWPGTYSCSFTICSYLQIGDIVWPAGTVPPRDRTDGISQIWDGCQQGSIAIPGWGWVNEPAPATIRIVPHPLAGHLVVADCRWLPILIVPTCNFAAGIAGATGEEPCGPSNVEPTTWSNIKAMFR